MNFGDFTEQASGPISTDFLAGYATGGGAGSDRRTQVGNLLKSIGSVTIGSAFAGNAGIEIGRIDGTASTPFIDFHSSGNNLDYDCRLIASGSPGSPDVIGGGSLLFSGATFAPQTNDAAPLGNSSLAWSDIFIASGGVLNFASGNYTITHASTIMTFETTATGVMARLQNDDAGALGVAVDFFANSASPANADIITSLRFSGKSSNGTTRQYGGIECAITDTTNTSEDADVNLQSIIAGTLATRLKVGLDITVRSDIATPAAGSTSARLLFGTTAGFGIYYGSGAPTVSAALGSLYLRSDGVSNVTRAYINNSGSTTWTAINTVA